MNKPIAMAILCCMLILGCAFMATENYQSRLTKEIQSKQLLLKQTAHIASKKQLGRFKATPLADGAIDSKIDETLFIRNVEQIARNASVKMVQIKPSRESGGNSEKRLILDLDFSASAPETIRFLYELKRRLRARTESLDMAAAQSSESAPLTIRLKIARTLGSSAAN